jgi:hypothetical protein
MGPGTVTHLGHTWLWKNEYGVGVTSDCSMIWKWSGIHYTRFCIRSVLSPVTDSLCKQSPSDISQACFIACKEWKAYTTNISCVPIYPQRNFWNNWKIYKKCSLNVEPIQAIPHSKVLGECKTWSLTARKDHTLKPFETQVRRAFGCREMK